MTATTSFPRKNVGMLLFFIFQCPNLIFITYFYAVYATDIVHKVYKKQAYPMQKSQFFLRPFYVLST